MGLAERWGLLFMATGTLVFTTLFVSHTFFTKNAIIVSDLGGIGGLFTLGLCTACALYFITMWRMARKLQRCIGPSEVGTSPRAILRRHKHTHRGDKRSKCICRMADAK